MKQLNKINRDFSIVFKAFQTLIPYFHKKGLDNENIAVCLNIMALTYLDHAESKLSEPEFLNLCKLCHEKLLEEMEQVK